MTVAQIQNLQAFVMNHLADVIDWGKHVKPDPEHKSSADQAHVLITTPFNRYKMSVRSTYIDPPPGAPFQCRSLGTVTFDDFAGNKHVIGPKTDAIYTDIAKHVHVRELTDALAAARREMAEAAPDTAAQVRVKLAGLAEKAKKYGIDAKVPEAALVIFTNMATDAEVTIEVAHSTEAQQAADKVSGVSDAMLGIVSPAGAAWLGCPVIFITNPGESISGMTEIPGHCVKILSGDRISMFVTPDHSEPSYRDALPRRGSPAGNGRVHLYNCWDFNPEYEQQRKRLRYLEEAMARMADEGNADRVLLDDLIARVQMLETQRDGAVNAKPAQVEKAALPLDKPHPSTSAQDAKSRKTG